MASIIKLRRNPIPVPDPADNVVVCAVVLRCTRCSSTWQARLGPFGDEVEDSDARCPRCDQEPPAAA